MYITRNNTAIMGGTLVYTGKFVGHDGQHVWIRANGGDSTDSVLFSHVHDNPQWLMREFNGKVVDVVAHTNWNGKVTCHTIHHA